jgi:glutamate synthase domain-containing protein 3
MTGGKAIVLDLNESLRSLSNMESIEIFDINDLEDNDEECLLRSLLTEHIDNTSSRWAKKISNNFVHDLEHFMVVIPKKTSEIPTISGSRKVANDSTSSGSQVIKIGSGK